MASGNATATYPLLKADHDLQGVMQQMPPLPVRLNVELANNFLPKAVANGVCQMPYMAAPMHGERL